jgi:hypothetical protein
MLELLPLEWAGADNPSCPAATLAEETKRLTSSSLLFVEDCAFKKVGVKDTEMGDLRAVR